MIIVMEPGASREKIQAVVERVQSLGLGAHPVEGEERSIVGVVGTPLPPTLDEMLEVYPGVERVVRITKKFKLSGWDFHPKKTIIKVLDFEIGGEELTLIAGPCSVESEEQTISTAHAVKAAGAKALRGGAYKPRTSPYEFRGLGKRGLEILAQARAETGLATSKKCASTPTSSRSARATRRTTTCSKRSARRASRSCSSADSA